MTLPPTLVTTHLIPLVSWLGHVGLGRNSRQDATRDGMCTKFLLSGRIPNLDFNHGPHGLLTIRDVEVEPAVAAFLVLVFKLALKIFVFVLQPQVVAVSRPVSFTLARLQMNDTLFAERPVASRLKVLL